MSALADMAEGHEEKPWYRHLWPWLVMIPPAVAVIGGLATAWLAGGPPALVVDDYADIARVTVERAERDQRARQLALSVRLELPAVEASDGRLRAYLTSGLPGFDPPKQLNLELIHPTLEELDQSLRLERSGEVFSVALRRPPGRLYLQLSDPDAGWRLVAELPANANQVTLSAPVAEHD
jgi:hypothetical protein